MQTLHEKSVRYLARHVEEILSKQNQSGEFWPDAGIQAAYNTDYQQFAYYPLAYLYTLEHPANPWKGNVRLLESVERSLRNNLAIQNLEGRYLMSSHDHAPRAEHGNWRSFSFLRTWELLRGVLAKDLDSACEKSLRLVFPQLAQLSREEATQPLYCRHHHIRNHGIWFLASSYALARHFGDAQYAAWAAGEFERICACQHPAGCWFEHQGPVVVYQHVTMSGLSHYHALSGSPAALEALQRCLHFYRLNYYPSGHPVEVLDGRVRYTGYAVSILPAAWARLPAGRALLHHLLDRLLEQPLGAGYHTHGGWLGLPFFTQFARDLGSAEPPADPNVSALAPEGVHALPELPLRQIRKGPWTVTLSAFTRPADPEGRWALDYQAHLSVYHERAGLLVGGGGSKRQAAFSLFTGGSRPLGLPCLAQGGSAETTGQASARLTLDYPGFQAVLEAQVLPDAVELSARVNPVPGSALSAEPIFLQLPFPMQGEVPVSTGGGKSYPADVQSEIAAEHMGGALIRKGQFTLSGLAGAHASLHLLPYNTHWRNGWSHRERAMGVVALPLSFGAARKIFLRAD